MLRYAPAPVPECAGTGGVPVSLRVTRAETLPQTYAAKLLVAVDSLDTAIVVGPSTANQNEDPGPTVMIIPRSGVTSKTTFANAITPDAIAVDLSGNIWMAGQLFRPVSFGAGAVAAVDAGYYLAKLTPDARPVFVEAILRVTTPWLRAIATDPQGNAYVVGSIGDGNVPSNDSVFVTKFAPNGAEIFNQQFSSQGSSAWASDVAIAPDGEVWIVGAHNATLYVGATTLTVPARSIDTGFFAALDPATGAARRAFGFGGDDFDIGNSIEVTRGGALRISGLLSGAATIGGMTAQAGDLGSPFLAELTAAGVANRVDIVAPGDGIVFAGDTNSAGRTFAVGYVADVAKETFVAAVDPGGPLTIALRATIGFDTNGALVAAADRHGGVWVVGDFKGSVNFDGNTLLAPSTTAFGNFLIHLEP